MIEILVGMIASGKSTFSKDRAVEGWLVLNDDAIVNLLHANFYPLYQERLKPLYKSIENTIVQNSILMSEKLVIDRGLNITKKSRKRFISIAKSMDCPVRAIVFPKEKPDIHAERRFSHDPRGHSLEYWLEVASHHSNIYEDPTLEEGFDEIIVIDYYIEKRG